MFRGRFWQLFLLAAVLVGLCYLFAPHPSTAPTLDAEPVELLESQSTTTNSNDGGATAIEPAGDPLVVDDGVSPGTIILTGTFMGLIESEPDQDRRTFQYLLLNDGTEMIRIDLRPLVGWSDLNIEEKLGVVRGEVIKVEGFVDEASGRFVPELVRYHDDVIEVD